MSVSVWRARAWFWLVEVPATIVTVYTWIWAIAGNLLFIGVLVLMALWFGFGIRWGW
jgi:hypothetical protein